MSIERAKLEDLGGELGEAIADTPEYERFESAREAVQRDEEIQEKISEFERLRQEFTLARQTGEATEEDVQTVKRAQQELHEMPAMADYLEAQEELSRRLERLNEAISEPLALDFGEQIGGCCHD